MRGAAGCGCCEVAEVAGFLDRKSGPCRVSVARWSQAVRISDLAGSAWR
jgi:hypothetical protein